MMIKRKYICFGILLVFSAGTVNSLENDINTTVLKKGISDIVANDFPEDFS